jgi:hypothetical protein
MELTRQRPELWTQLNTATLDGAMDWQTVLRLMRTTAADKGAKSDDHVTGAATRAPT